MRTTVPQFEDAFQVITYTHLPVDCSAEQKRLLGVQGLPQETLSGCRTMHRLTMNKKYGTKSGPTGIAKPRLSLKPVTSELSVLYIPVCKITKQQRAPSTTLGLKSRIALVPTVQTFSGPPGKRPKQI